MLDFCGEVRKTEAVRTGATLLMGHAHLRLLRSAAARLLCLMEQHLLRGLQYAQPDVMDEDAFRVVCVAVLTASLVIFRLTTPARPLCRKPEDPGMRAAGGSGKVPLQLFQPCRQRGLALSNAASMPEPLTFNVDADAFCHEAVTFLRNLGESRLGRETRPAHLATASRELLTAASTSLSSRANAVVPPR